MTARHRGPGAPCASTLVVGALLGALLLGAVALGCGGASPPTTRASRPPLAGGLPAASLGTQSLFRVTYEGPEGRGTLRLTLRLEAPERYRLSAADGFGRALWSLERTSREVVLMDHRRSTWCRLADRLGLPEPSLSEVPVRAVPVVLLGGFPVPGQEGPAADVVDLGGRRWTGRWQDRRLVSWTLWRDGEPLVWWQGLGTKATLSHREGMQLRWRRTVVEQLGGELGGIEIPVDYREETCDVAGLP